MTLQVRLVTPDYFRTMGIPVVRGRGFTPADRMGSQPVAMLNETAAARVWPDQDAIGHHLEIGTRFGMGGNRAGGTVIGIAGDVRDSGPASPVAPTLYLSHGQWPDGSVTIVARARNGEPSSLVAAAARDRCRTSIPMCRCRRCDRWISCRRPRSRSRACIWS